MAELISNGKTGNNVQVPILRRLSWADKIANNYQWFRDGSNWIIANASLDNLDRLVTSGKNDLTKTQEITELLGVYHNVIPKRWFTHVTDVGDINGGKEFQPAKIRPLNFVRTNIDYLSSSFRKRPLKASVENTSEGAYNTFIEKKKEFMENVLRKRFIQKMQTEQGEQEVDNTPEELIADFGLKYKDALAAKMQLYLKKAMKDYDVHETLYELFDNYAIYGEPVSFKTIQNGKLIYRRIDRRNFDYGRNPNINYIEDADWCIYREQLSLNEIVDRFYPIMKESDWEKLEKNGSKFSPVALRDYLVRRGEAVNRNGGAYNVYHTVWKGFEKKYKLWRRTPTGVEELDVDENYVMGEDDLDMEAYWCNKLYHTTRVGDDLYLATGEYPYADDGADIKLPYNGITYAYKTDKVLSPLKVGIPYLILYLICHFSAEKLLAKNKGKVLILDYNVIPNRDGWNEKKFMQYLEAMGYAFIRRDQVGVDKSFNQYNAIDMSTLKDVSELIKLASYYKEEWDDVIGIPRQSRGQTMASDQPGTVKSAIIQSGVVTDAIFQKFEDFVKRDLQGIMELCKFLTLEGASILLENEDEYGSELLRIEPGEFLAPLGIKITNNAVELDKLASIKEYAKIVNQQEPLDIVEIMTQDNIAGLKKVLRRITKSRQDAGQQQSQQEHANMLEIEEMKETLLRLESELTSERMEREYDRKAEIEYIKGDIAITTSKQVNTGDTNLDGVTDINDIMERAKDRQTQENIENKKIQVKREEIAAKERMNRDNNVTALKNKVVGERSKAKTRAK